MFPSLKLILFEKFALPRSEGTGRFGGNESVELLLHGVLPPVVVRVLGPLLLELLQNFPGHGSLGIPADAGESVGDLEVGDGGSGRASNPRLAVAGKSALDDGQYLVPVLGEPLLSALNSAGLSAHDGRLDIGNELAHMVLDEVENGVNGPGGHGVLGVVAKTDAEHAQDGVRLGHADAVFLPNRHGAKRVLWVLLDAGKLLEREAVVLVLEVGVEEKSANGLTATTHVEVVQLSWHFFRFYFICDKLRQTSRSQKS